MAPRGAPGYGRKSKESNGRTALLRRLAARKQGAPTKARKITRFWLKQHPRRACWALKGCSFGFSGNKNASFLDKAPLEGVQLDPNPEPDLVVLVIAPEN